MPQPKPAARRQLEFLKRQGGLIILVTAAALAAASVTTLLQHNVYRASTKIVVGQGGGIFDPQFGNAVQPATQTMSSLLKSDIVATTVIRDLGLQETPKSLLRHVQVSSTPDSSVLQVSFDSRNRDEAVRTLDKVASVFTSLVRRKLGKQPVPSGQSTSLPVVTATVFDPAHADPNPISPHPGRTIVISGIIGLVLGIILALLRDTLDERLRGQEEMEDYFGAPVIAALPRSMLDRRALENTHGPVSSFVHAIEPLRLQLARAHERLIVVTSGGAREGKSAVAANLSVALAVTGADVICIDGDPGDHSLTHYLNFHEDNDHSPGSVAGSADVAQVLHDIRLDTTIEGLVADKDEIGEQAGGGNGRGRGGTGRLRLFIWSSPKKAELEALPHGSIADLATDLLESEQGYIVVDAPPLPSGTTFALLSSASRAIIVATEEKTTKEEATSVRATVERLQVASYAIVTLGRTAKTGGAYLPGYYPRSSRAERKAL
jgi:succinoglycan biosynthesis transport protein ExoP